MDHQSSDAEFIERLRLTLAGPPVVLDVPRKLRARWSAEHAIDGVGCWLVEHRCWRLAVALWWVCGLW